MHALRRSRHIARLVLAWLVLAMGAAVASPLVRPASLALVCTAAGASLVSTEGGEALPAPGHALDCPLCLHLLAPPPPDVVAAVPGGMAHPALVPACTGGVVATLSAPPLPARGPPALS